MMVLALGEISNIFMVPWHTARYCNYPALSHMLSTPVTISFSLMRIVVAPYFTYEFFVEALTTDHGIPPMLLNVYMLAFVLLLLGSWLWTYRLIRGYLKTHRDPAAAAATAATAKRK